MFAVDVCIYSYYFILICSLIPYSWRSISREILATAHVSIVRISPCFRSVSNDIHNKQSFFFLWKEGVLFPTRCVRKNEEGSICTVLALYQCCIYFWSSRFTLFPCPPPQVCQISLERPWWSCTVPNVWTSTHQSPPGTTTQMEHILALGSPTCSSWFTLSTGPRGPPTSLSPG